MEMPAPPVDDSCKSLYYTIIHNKINAYSQTLISIILLAKITFFFFFFILFPDYHRQSPYSSGYEDNSSPLSIACSPHSTISNGSISYEFMAPPHSDTLTTMASTAPGVPPLPPPPTCITTLPLTTSTFQAGIESQKCIYTTAPPVYYPPITQVDAWPPQPPPPSLTRFSEPTGFVPPHSSAVMGTSVAEGEVPINVIEQAFPDSDSIIYYPLTPESPEDKHNTFQCADYAPPPSDIYPTGVAAMPMCTPYMPHVLSKQQTATNLKRELILKAIAVYV